MRGRFLFSISCAAGLLFAPINSFAKDKAEPVVLEPSTYWSLDYAENKCRLARAFGEDENRHILFFEQYGPGTGFAMTVAGPAFDRFNNVRKTMLQFGSTLEPKETSPFFGNLGTIEPALIYGMTSFTPVPAKADDGLPIRPPITDLASGAISHISLTEAAQVQFLSFSQRRRTVTLQTGDLEEAMKALNTCARTFLAAWGLDVDQHVTATRLPVWTNQRVIARRVQNLYPKRALRAGEQGVFRMRLIVDETGGVAECDMMNVTITERLESEACGEMDKAEFQPALDVSGNSMRSYFILTLKYSLG